MKIINNSLEHSFENRKGKSPPVGVKPDASHLLDDYPYSACLTDISVVLYNNT